MPASVETANPSLGTAAAAHAVMALMLIAAPATTPPAQASGLLLRPAIRTVSSLAPREEREPRASTESTIGGNKSRNIDIPQLDGPDRETSPKEKLLGEIRRWALLKADWDGESASVPIFSSIKDAVSFARLLNTDLSLPEPMLHSSGRVGLFWKDTNSYADLEFIGDGRIAYYIEQHGDKHKGVLKFDSKTMPPVFTALLTT
jgi:hypothetical protein